MGVAIQYGELSIQHIIQECIWQLVKVDDVKETSHFVRDDFDCK